MHYLSTETACINSVQPIFLPTLSKIRKISDGIYTLNSLSTIKQTTKIASTIFQKMLSPSYIILGIQRLEGKQHDLDEVAHDEPPHQDLRCLQIQLFSSLVVKELKLL